jgi:TolB-like protein/tetratricopeptide (TPR) repeat protein
VALLRVLIERAGAPVSKDTLIDAAWSGLAVEESNLTVQIATLRRVLDAEPGGDKWIETLPRRGYRFVGPVVTKSEAQVPAAPMHSAAQPSPTTVRTLPDKPSIAVLPFENLSGDPEQEYFADGIVEDIITALSRMRWLFVIGRNSTFTFKGRHVNVRHVGSELEVRYVLEGSVRRAGNRVRISAQLMDVSTGAHLWADRFDGTLEDIFDLQDSVTARVVGAIGPKLEQAEIERARRKPTANLDAYDCYLRGVASFHKWNRKGIAEALEFFYKAIALDREFAAVYGMAAWCFVPRRTNNWMEDRDRETSEAGRLARQAAKLGKDDAVALYTGGYALANVVGDLDTGAGLIDRALALNPNLAAAWHNSGWVRIYLGAHEAAIEHIRHAMRLSPLDSLLFGMQGAVAFAHYFAGRYEEALRWADKAVREQPLWLSGLVIVAASKAMSGQLDDAQRAAKLACQRDATFCVAEIEARMPLRQSSDLARLAEGLRKAGIRER